MKLEFNLSYIKEIFKKLKKFFFKYLKKSMCKNILNKLNLNRIIRRIIKIKMTK